MASNRRSFIKKVGGTGVLLAVAGCAVPTTVPQYVSDAQLIEQVVAAAIPQVTPFIRDPLLLNRLKGYLTQVQAATAAVSSSLTATAATPMLNQIVQAMQAVADIILPIVGIPSALIGLINTALALVPAIVQAAGLSSVTEIPILSKATINASSLIGPADARTRLQQILATTK